MKALNLSYATVLLALSAGLGGAASVLGEEITVHNAQALAIQSPGPDHDIALQTAYVACQQTCLPREGLAIASALDTAGRAQPSGPRRETLLKQADQILDIVSRAQPEWAAMWLRRADVDAAAAKPDGIVLADLERSYALAPFLAAEGSWRTTAVAADWDRASPLLRRRALAEAAWLIKVKPEIRDAVRASFAASDSAETALRLEEISAPPARVNAG